MTTIALRSTARTAVRREEQYSLAKILSIWAVVSLPMPILAFVVAPALYSSVDLLPGIVYWNLMILGMMWQFVVSLFIVYRELGTLRWSAIRERTWLTTPRDPQTGKSQAGAFLVARAGIFVCRLRHFWYGQLSGVGDGMALSCTYAVAKPQPGRTEYPRTDRSMVAGSSGNRELSLQLFFGEEFLFRGVLLPKMQGAFGKWDWVANAVLFGAYHLHKPLGIPSIILSSLAYTWTSRRFRSNWFAVVLHGFEGVFVLIPVLAVVTGAAF